jgi:hypothetical protein
MHFTAAAEIAEFRAFLEKDHFLPLLGASAVKIVFKERTYGQVTS